MVVRVVGWREHERNVSEEVFLATAHTARARLGNHWRDSWFFADVELPDGHVVTLMDEHLEILDLEQTRGPGFRPAGL